MKIAAAVAIAAVGFGGGMAYKKFRAYLREKQSRKQVAAKPSVARKQPRTRKKSATKPKRNRGKGFSEIEGKAARAAVKE